MTETLYIVVRADLDPGLQLAQVAHVAIAAGAEAAPVGARVLVYHAEDRSKLLDVGYAAMDAVYASSKDADPVHATTFKEPDLGDETTSIALWGGRAASVVKGLRRAFEPSEWVPPPNLRAGTPSTPPGPQCVICGQTEAVDVDGRIVQHSNDTQAVCNGAGLRPRTSLVP